MSTLQLGMPRIHRDPSSAPDTAGRPDNIANVSISTTPGTQLDIANLDKIGLFTVPVQISTACPA